MAVPKDPVILLSYVNTQLRDNYSTLRDFCLSTGCDETELIQKLSSIGYEYSAELNKFL